MKINVSLTLAILCCVVINSQAQEKESKKVELRVYYNYEQSNYKETFDYVAYDYLNIHPEITNYSLGDISIGLILNRNEKTSHEFEIMPFSFNKNKLIETYTESEEDSWAFGSRGSKVIKSRLRYQYNYTFFDKSKIDFYLGFSSMLSYFYQDFNAYNSLSFPKSYSQIGLILGLTPGFKIPLAEKLNFTFDVPIGILGLNYRRMKNEWAELPLNQQTQSTISGEVWNQGFQVRAGLGFTF